MRLVAPRNQRAAARPHHHAVEIICRAAINLTPDCAGYQNRLRWHAGAQPVGERRAFIQIKRQSGFRPHDKARFRMRANSAHGLREHGRDDIGLARRIPFFLLVYIWLNQQTRFAGRSGCGFQHRDPRRAQPKHRYNKKKARQTHPPCSVSNECGDNERHKSQPMNTDPSNWLGSIDPAAENHRWQVPRKTGQKVAARHLTGGPEKGQ